MTKYEKIAKWIASQNVDRTPSDKDIKEIAEYMFGERLTSTGVKYVKEELSKIDTSAKVEDSYLDFVFVFSKNDAKYFAKKYDLSYSILGKGPSIYYKFKFYGDRENLEKLKKEYEGSYEMEIKDQIATMEPLDYIKEALDKEGIEYEVNEDIYGFNPPYYASISILDPNNIDLADEIICSIVGEAYQVNRDKYGNKSSFNVATEQEDIDEINGTPIKDKKIKDSFEDNIVYEGKEFVIVKDLDNNNKVWYTPWFKHKERGSKEYSPTTINFKSLEEAKKYMINTYKLEDSKVRDSKVTWDDIENAIYDDFDGTQHSEVDYNDCLRSFETRKEARDIQEFVEERFNLKTEILKDAYGGWKVKVYGVEDSIKDKKVKDDSYSRWSVALNNPSKQNSSPEFNSRFVNNGDYSKFHSIAGVFYEALRTGKLVNLYDLAKAFNTDKQEIVKYLERNYPGKYTYVELASKTGNIKMKSRDAKIKDNYSYALIKEDKYYDPEGLNIDENEKNVLYVGATKQECLIELEILHKEMKDKYSRDKNVSVSPITGTQFYVYFMNAISKDYYRVVEIHPNNIKDASLTHKQKLWYGEELEKFIHPQYLRRNYQLKRIKKKGKRGK